MLHQLSGQDATFIHMDVPHAGTHGTMIYIYDPSETGRPVPRFAEVAAHLERRLAGLPMLRRRLQRVPLDLDNPYWVSDERFDFAHHVRPVTLPAPGTWEQLTALAAEVQSRPVDLTRAPWEMYVVEGLDAVSWLPRGGLAILTKMHHCAVDGTAFRELTWALHDLTPDAGTDRTGGAEAAQPVRAPGPVTMAARALAHNVLAPVALARPLRKVVPALLPAAARFYGRALRERDAAPVTRFNADVSAQRVFSSRIFALDEVHAIRAAVPGATVNDVVLAVVGGALRRYLDTVGEGIDPSLVALLPMNTRESDAEYRTSGNTISFYRTSLGTDTAAGLDRLRAVHAGSRRAKQAAWAAGAREITEISNHTPPAAMPVVGRLLMSAGLGGRGAAPLHHCGISNVPGPPVPLYLRGTELVYWSCVLPITDGLGLGFAVSSINGRLIISPTSCPEMVPDPELLCAHLQASFDELLDATRQAAA